MQKPHQKLSFLLPLITTLLMLAFLDIFIRGPFSNPLKHFQPNRSSIIKIEFDYPRDWVLDRKSFATNEVIRFYEPAEANACNRWLIIFGWVDLAEATRKSNNYNCSFSNSKISLIAKYQQFAGSAEKNTNTYLDELNNHPSSTLIDQQVINIDGQPAQLITVYTENLPDPWFVRKTPGTRARIYFQNDRMLYEFRISFVGPQGAESTLYKTFIAILESIEFVP